jgi:type IV secretion system protein VirB9
MRAPILAGTVCSIIALAAHAADTTHIKQVPYAATQRTEVVGVVGQPTTITFPPGESVYRVVQSEHAEDGGLAEAAWRGPRPEDVKDTPIGGNLPLWPMRPGTSTMTIVTVEADGSQKVYPFRLVARADDAGAEDAPDVTLNLIFTAPDKVKQAAAARAWAIRKSAADQENAKDRLRVDAFNGTEGCHYRAKGKKTTSIEPRCPMDNGQWTLMRFPGLSSKPAVYIVTGDNEERLARQHGSGDFVVVEEIAEHFRLRLGQDVLDILNDGYEAAGRPTDTGTVSAGVLREVIQEKRIAPPHGG